MSDRTIRVGLADDQRLMRDGLRIILEAAPDITVVGAADDGEAAVALAVSTRPDVLLLDIRMPRLDGIEAARRIAQVVPATRVVLLTTFDEPDLVAEGVRAGVAGFLLKDSSADELRSAVRAVARGQLLFQGQGTAHLLAGHAPPAAPAFEGEQFGLTERELEVLRCIAQGKTNAEIATELVVSETTVKTHVNHVFAKLGARDRAHAILLAQRHHFT